MPTPLPLDSTAIRALFPAFSEPDLRRQAFFENAGGSYMSRHVLSRLEGYHRRMRVQPYGASAASIAAGEAMDVSYLRLAEALGVTPDWIHIGPSTSANTYVLGNAFAGLLQPGDAIIVTNQDHEANSGAWRRLEALGIEVREWRVSPSTGQLDLAGLDALLDGKVKLVAAPHVSNIVGEINPVAEITARTTSAGAVSIIDGVSYVPHGPPDVAALGADIYLFSAYKTYGPHQGVMAVRPELAERLPNQGHYFNATRPRTRLNPAGPDHAQVAALAGIVDYFEEVAVQAGGGVHGETPFHRAHAAMRAQEVALSIPLFEYLRGRNGIRLIGPGAGQNRAPTISLALPEPGAEVAKRLAKHGIMAGGGNFYAVRLLQALGIHPAHGVLRLSFVHYTSRDEVSRLIRALEAEGI